MNTSLSNKLIILACVIFIFILSIFTILPLLLSPRKDSPVSNTVPSNSLSPLPKPTDLSQIPTPNFYLPLRTNIPQYNMSFLDYSYPFRYKNLILDLQHDKKILMVYYAGTKKESQKTLKEFFTQYGFSDPIETSLQIYLIGLDKDS